jgi:Fe-S-cluster-containing hydrogenase component 2
MSVKLNKDKCASCAGCVAMCPQLALDYVGSGIQIDPKKCIECGICVKFCPLAALYIGDK